jgi:hypothetical protein
MEFARELIDFLFNPPNRILVDSIEAFALRIVHLG